MTTIDLAGGVNIFRRQQPAAEQMQSQCLEHSFAAQIEPSVQRTGRNLSREADFTGCRGCDLNRGIYRGGGDTRQRGDSLQNLLVERFLLFGGVVASFWNVKLRDYYVLRAESHVYMRESVKGAQHQSGAGQQDDRKSHLHDHQG